MQTGLPGRLPMHPGHHAQPNGPHRATPALQDHPMPPLPITTNHGHSPRSQHRLHPRNRPRRQAQNPHPPPPPFQPSAELQHQQAHHSQDLHQPPGPQVKMLPRGPLASHPRKARMLRSRLGQQPRHRSCRPSERSSTEPSKSRRPRRSRTQRMQGLPRRVVNLVQNQPPACHPRMGHIQMATDSQTVVSRWWGKRGWRERLAQKAQLWLKNENRRRRPWRPLDMPDLLGRPQAKPTPALRNQVTAVTVHAHPTHWECLADPIGRMTSTTKIWTTSSTTTRTSQRTTVTADATDTLMKTTTLTWRPATLTWKTKSRRPPAWPDSRTSVRRPSWSSVGARRRPAGKQRLGVNACLALHMGVGTPGDRLSAHLGMHRGPQHAWPTQADQQFHFYICLILHISPRETHNMAFEKRGGRDHGAINLPFLGRGAKRCLGIPRRQGHGSIAAGVLLILLLVFIQACSHGVGAFLFPPLDL